MQFTTNKDKGRAGISMAIAYFGSNRYTVSIPMNDTQWYDLIVEKYGIFQTVQCKATGNCENSIALRSMGGNAGKVYDSVLNHPVDLLFCLDKECNMFVIPVDVIKEAGNKNAIILSTKSRSQGIDTASYLVHL
jgi:hypothetical protein